MSSIDKEQFGHDAYDIRDKTLKHLNKLAKKGDLAEDIFPQAKDYIEGLSDGNKTYNVIRTVKTEDDVFFLEFKVTFTDNTDGISGMQILRSEIEVYT